MFLSSLRTSGTYFSHSAIDHTPAPHPTLPMMDSGTFYLWQGSGEWLSSGHTIRPSSTPCSPTRDWKQPARAPSHSRIRVAWRGMTWYNLCTNSACWLWKEMEGILWINFQDTWIILCKRLKKKNNEGKIIQNFGKETGNTDSWNLNSNIHFREQNCSILKLKLSVPYDPAISLLDVFS